MSIYPKVTQQDLINLGKLAEQPKNQRAIRILNRTLEHTHDIKLAENLSPMTKKIEEFNESSKKIREVKRE